MLEDRAVDVMISGGLNFFYTVTLPCTLWFLDWGKKHTKLSHLKNGRSTTTCANATGAISSPPTTSNKL
jgi:hypothetical protein